MQNTLNNSSHNAHASEVGFVALRQNQPAPSGRPSKLIAPLCAALLVAARRVPPRWAVLPLLLTLLLAAGPLAAQQMNYQGRLTDANGNAVADGQYTLRFDIFDAATAGTRLWGTQTNVTDVVQGRFNVVLGPTAPTGGPLGNAFNGGNRFLQITVGNNSPITPRQQMLAAPEALHALKADYATVAAAVGNGGSSVISLLGNNVGIGTNTPQASLHLNGDLLVQNTAAGDAYSAVHLRNDTGNGDGYIFKNSSTRVLDGGANTMTVRNDAGDLRLQAQGGFNTSNGITVKPSGNVGIGTTTPTSKLTVNASGNGILHTDGTTHLGTYVNATGGFFGTRSAHPLYFFVADGGASMTVTTAGNVGIGTAAPQDHLDVNGVVRGTGFRCRAGTGGGVGNVFNFNWTGTALEGWVDNVFQGYVSFFSDRRLKENIEPLPASALDRVMALRPVSFKYKNIPDSIFSGSPDTHEGFIADELQAVIPSAVKGSKDGLTKEGEMQPQTLNLAPVVSVLTKATQELARKVEAQESELTDLRAELAQLRSEKKSFAATVEDMAARFARLEQAMNKTTPTAAKDLRASANAK